MRETKFRSPDTPQIYTYCGFQGPGSDEILAAVWTLCEEADKPLQTMHSFRLVTNAAGGVANTAAAVWASK